MLKKVWYIMDCICGKRLAPVLNEVVVRLQRYREISVDGEVKRKLQKISPATIDRLLAKERRKQTIKGRSNTKPGTLLKHQILIRNFSDWKAGSLISRNSDKKDKRVQQKIKGTYKKLIGRVKWIESVSAIAMNLLTRAMDIKAGVELKHYLPMIGKS